VSVHFGPGKPGIHTGGRTSAEIHAEAQEATAVFHPPQARETITPGIATVRDVGDIPAYSGQTHVIPSQREQVLSTAGKRMTENVTVEPIPSNYGLITWDGSVLTVS
jgi:hypothetical protein